MTSRKLLAGAVVVLTLTAARATAEPSTARYRLRTGDGPARIIVRHCGTGEDSWSTVRLVDYGDERAVIRCARRGY